jgi:hypothetical protein
MHGLGDNIYQRSFVKALSNQTDVIYLETSWPELYEDIDNIKFIKKSTKLRTQYKNAERNTSIKWVNNPPSDLIPIRVQYSNQGIMSEMSRCFGILPNSIDLPDWSNEYPWIRDLGKFILLRPVTVRREWKNTARNPSPSYVYDAVNTLQDQGYSIVSIADIMCNEEWLVGSPRKANVEFHKGELTVKELMTLVKLAHVVIGGVGWLVPAAIAYGTPAWIVLGGNGNNNHPSKIGEASNITYAMPDNYCMCSNPLHECNKYISDYTTKFNEWVKIL